MKNELFKIVFAAIAMLFGATMSFAQGYSLKGVITGTDGQPVIGAAVIVNGTSHGAATDVDGSYVLEMSLPPAADATVTVSCIGYRPQTVSLASA